MMALDVTHLLEGHWFGRYGTAPCPVCQPDRQRDQNALTLTDGNNGRLLAHCKKSACAFSDILAATGLRSGDYTAPDAATLAQRASERRAEAQRQALRASYLWKEAQPVTGTLAETYLRWRGITCTLRVTLRFHPECWHGPTAKRYPALVALVEGSEGFAVHRTYLSVDGTRKAALDPARMMLGTVAGGAVRLVDGLGPLVLAEGIETALSLASGLLRAPASIWAALSTTGMRGLRLPSTPGRLTITPDGDSAGREAAHALAERATALGWAVSLLPAPEGRDWNDILQMKGVAT
ncbi:toprim domain-containing protein [Ruegeria pomeroyi]|uniref:Toprim domain-containing protein n=1 Tax=Ruegeria pomeroyi TaxID=89184 RepID=A0A9Q3WR59_9RHOB|nr:toprim domain-containing protein [Ruegeria pomeroyi]MCE8540280.1 toprim domain-containing protein [Ruegeria pomeroyi]